MKTVKIKIYPSREQKVLIDEIFDVTKFLYNKANHLIKRKKFHWTQKISMRNILVTERTKADTDTYKDHSIEIEHLRNLIKLQKNDLMKEIINNRIRKLMKIRTTENKKESYSINNEIKEFEKRVSNSIRQCAVANLCDAYKSAHSNFIAGHNKGYNMEYKKKKDPRQCFEMTKRDIKMTTKGFEFCKQRFKENSILRMSKKNQEKYGKHEIQTNCDLLRQKGLYYIAMPVYYKEQPSGNISRFCGVDPGVRTFATSFGNTGIAEYHGNMTIIKKIAAKIKRLKEFARTRKKHFNKLEKRKIDFTNNLHWSCINELLHENDIVFFGDIKSHGIVKNGPNKTLNRNINDLKFYVFKQRLLYKAKQRGKKVFMVPENYTTQGCSTCGNLWKTIGSSKIYKCDKCNLICDRDINAAKNILMKGLLYFKDTILNFIISAIAG